MNKFAKFAILFGLGLMLFGMIITAFNFNTLFRPFFNENVYEHNTYLATGPDINKIAIDTEDTSIKIKTYTGDVVKITYDENDDFNYKLTEENGIITIKNTIKPCFFCLNFNFTGPEIIIEVPESIVLSYNLETSNARLEIVGVKLAEANFETNNARIDLSNIIQAEKITLKSSNARININNVTAEQVNIKTSNGRIDVDNAWAKSFEFKTSNGEINLTKVMAEDKIMATTSNGKIKFANLMGPIIDLKTSNARVEGNLVGSVHNYQKQFKTSNSYIKINDIDYGTIINDSASADNLLIIKTSNGSINVNFS